MLGTINHYVVVMGVALKTVLIALMAAGVTYVVATSTGASGPTRAILGNISAPTTKIVLSGFAGLIAAALHAITA